jgi:hypothetical protein
MFVDPLSWLADEFPGDETTPASSHIRSAPNTSGFGPTGPDLLVGFREELHMTVEETRRRAETLFKKEQQQREAQQAMSEYQAGLRVMREKTARLRELRLARDAADQKALRPNQTTPRPKQKGAA